MEFAEVLNQELESIGLRRQRVRAMAPQPPPSESPAPAKGAETADAEVPGADSQGPADPTSPEKEARLTAMDRHLAGLALSGGGIRSATFALGVLQGLAALRILSRFDYLSTVSGGGYIGGWLAAWIKREGNPLSVEEQLAPSRIPESMPDRRVIGRDRIVDEEPEPIHHLRSYSNYLTPRPGLLSVDTWTVLTIYVRNAAINMLLLLPVAMIFVLTSRCIVWFYAGTGQSDGLRAGVLASMGGLLVLSFLSLGWHVCAHPWCQGPRSRAARTIETSQSNARDRGLDNHRPIGCSRSPCVLVVQFRIDATHRRTIRTCTGWESADDPAADPGLDPHQGQFNSSSRLQYK